MFGDIVIAYETLEREARNENRAFLHHLAHLTVHGFLHLIGYDHETDAQAEEMEGLESKIMTRLNMPIRMSRGILTTLDRHARQRFTKFELCQRPAAPSFEPRNLPVPVPPRGAKAAETGSRVRCARCSAGSRAPCAPTSKTFLMHEPRRIRLLAGREPDAQEHPGAARAAEWAMSWFRAPTSSRCSRTSHSASLCAFSKALAFAARGLQRHARRSGRHGAHPRPHRVHDGARCCRSGKERQAQEAAARRARSQGGRSRDAPVRHQDRARDPVRAAVDARYRSSGAHAGDAHPSGSGGRRIWRNGRPRFDRGHRRADRRRNRGRTR